MTLSGGRGSCLGRIRTLTKGARNLRATITPQGNLCLLTVFRFFLRNRCFRFASAKLELFHDSCKFFSKKISKKIASVSNLLTINIQKDHPSCLPDFH